MTYARFFFSASVSVGPSSPPNNSSSSYNSSSSSASSTAAPPMAPPAPARTEPPSRSRDPTRVPPSGAAPRALDTSSLSLSAFLFRTLFPANTPSPVAALAPPRLPVKLPLPASLATLGARASFSTREGKEVCLRGCKRGRLGLPPPC
jgi:hypothetical protein